MGSKNQPTHVRKTVPKYLVRKIKEGHFLPSQKLFVFDFLYMLGTGLNPILTSSFLNQKPNTWSLLDCWGWRCENFEVLILFLFKCSPWNTSLPFYLDLENLMRITKYTENFVVDKAKTSLKITKYHDDWMYLFYSCFHFVTTLILWFTVFSQNHFFTTFGSNKNI